MEMANAELQGSWEQSHFNPFIAKENEPYSREGLSRYCQW
jgi:hypothetical protein